MSTIADLKINVTELSSVLREVKIEIPWDEVATRIARRYGEIRRTMRPMRGFRKGKVPQWLLEQQLGPQVEVEVSQQLLSDALIEALTATEDLSPVTTPEVTEAEALKKGQPLAFTVHVEVRPKLENITFEGLELQRTVHEVGEPDIDHEVGRLREESASLQAPGEPRPARPGDVLVLDYEVRLEGSDEPERVKKDQEVELGKGMLLNQVEEALIGVAEGDVKVIPVDLPEQAGAEADEKKQIAFHVTVKDIREKILPDLDDEFAADVGYESYTQLRAAIREDLEKKVQAMADASLKDQLLDALCDANPVDVPPSLVQQQAEETESEVARMLQIDLDKMPFSDDQKERMHTQAERKVRAALLLYAISKQENLEVSEEAIDERLAEIAERAGQPLPKVRAEYGKGDRRDQLRSGMLQQKVVELLLERASITDRSPEDEAADSEEGPAQASPDGDAEAGSATPEAPADEPKNEEGEADDEA